jgi:hypothetical protein
VSVYDDWVYIGNSRDPSYIHYFQEISEQPWKISPFELYRSADKYLTTDDREELETYAKRIIEGEGTRKQNRPYYNEETDSEQHLNYIPFSQHLDLTQQTDAEKEKSENYPFAPDQIVVKQTSRGTKGQEQHQSDTKGRVSTKDEDKEAIDDGQNPEVNTETQQPKPTTKEEEEEERVEQKEGEGRKRGQTKKRRNKKSVRHRKGILK